MAAFSRRHPAFQFIYYVVVLTLSMVLPHPATILVSWLGAILALLPQTEAGKRLRLFLLPALVAIPTTLINAGFRHYGLEILFVLPSGNPVTLEAILDGAQGGLRLGVTMLWFTHLYKTLETDRLLYLFSPFPTFSLLLTLVLRYLPRFSGEARQLAAVRKLSDQDDKLPLRRRLQRQSSLLAALSGWALESSINTADAMQARGVSLRGPKTRYQLYRWTSEDTVQLAALATLTTLVAILTSQGKLDAFFYPYLYLPPWTGAGLLTFSCICLITLLPFIGNTAGSLRWIYSQQKI